MDSTSEICQESVKKVRPCASLRELLQIITITILSLLLPLAFLLLARLKTAHYLLAVSAYPTTNPLSLLASLFLYTDGSLQYVLVFIVTAAALIHGLTGKFTRSSRLTEPVCRPCLYTAWIFLCAFQVCVCLGIEGSIAAGIDASGFDQEQDSISRVVFFLGLHETMLYWSKTFVKPVVDDTLFESARKGRWIEKVVMALSFGTLWWWRLRGEIESLVTVVEVKREPLMGGGVADSAGWWLYYLTVAIGIVRVVKGLFWVGMILVCRRVEGNNGDDSSDDDSDEKV